MAWGGRGRGARGGWGSGRVGGEAGVCLGAGGGGRSTNSNWIGPASGAGAMSAREGLRDSHRPMSPWRTRDSSRAWRSRERRIATIEADRDGTSVQNVSAPE